ncbi:MAG: hypothetical protein CMH83_16815 [Nocardioides sp.]|nr:hypothetical protein [Nocardioides sp.]
MKAQRGADKKRGFAIVGVAVLVGLILVGAAAYRPIKDAWDSREFDSLELAQIGAPADVCGEVETKEASDVNNHIPRPQQVTYEDAPPAYGPHWNDDRAPAPFSDKFYDASDRPDLESLVHNLEHGYTILWYDDSVAADAEQVTQIRSIAKKFKSDDNNFRLKFIAAPWAAADEAESGTFPDGQHVAFTHWKGDSTTSTGVWQYCSETSGEALETFMQEYPYTDSPEKGAM